MPGVPIDDDGGAGSITINFEGCIEQSKFYICQLNPDSVGENWSTLICQPSTGSGMCVVTIDARNIGGSIDAFIYGCIDGQKWVCLCRFPTVDVDTKKTFLVTFGKKKPSTTSMVDCGSDNEPASSTTIHGTWPAGLSLRLKSNSGVIIGRDQSLQILRTS